MKKITLYCDGSSLGNPGFGGWCAILKYLDKQKIIKGAEPNTTNNQMELKASIEALKTIKESCQITLISDSKYVCEGINSWLKNWILKDFKKVKNSELWKEFLELSKNHEITATWVKGHSGHKENEECDKIAREEATKLKNKFLANALLIKNENYEEIISFLHEKGFLKNINHKDTIIFWSKELDSWWLDINIYRDYMTKNNITSSNSYALYDDLNKFSNDNELLKWLREFKDNIKIAKNLTKQNNKKTNTSNQNSKDILEKFQKNINYFFKNKDLLIQALTHKSYDKFVNNERLEFLGDAVLDLLIGEYVFKKLHDSDEGDLTKLRASMVNESSFTKLALAINLGDYLFISNAEVRNKGREKSSILSNAFEALIGSIYLDSGLEEARILSYHLLELVYKEIDLENLFKDYKTLLQELTQSICGVIPEYVLVGSSGPDHNKNFTIEILINGMKYAMGKGKSKKEAEQNCAKKAYEILKRENK